MGMSEQKTYILNLTAVASDPAYTIRERINALCELGLLQKEGYGYATTIRMIQMLARELKDES